MRLLGGYYYIKSSGKPLDFLLDFIRKRDIFYEIVQILSGQVLMGLFPAAKTDFYFNFMALLEEFLGLVFFEIEVMVVCPHSQADTFDFRFFLFGLILAFFSGFLILVLAEIHDFANGRLSFGSDFDQIKTSFFGHGYSLARVHNPGLFAIFIDKTDLFGPDRFINPGFELLFFRKRPPEICSSNGLLLIIIFYELQNKYEIRKYE